MNEQKKQELYKAFVECFGNKTCKDKDSGKYVVYWGSLGEHPEFYYDVVQYVQHFYLILKAIKQYGIDICWYGRYEYKEDICRITGYSFEHDKCAFNEVGNDLDLLVMQAVVAINKYEKANAHDKA